MDKLILYLLLIVVLFLVVFRLMTRRGGRRVVSLGFKRRMEPYLFMFPVLLLLLVMFGYPLINSIVMSFQNYKLTSPGKVFFNDFANYQKLFSSRDLGLIVRNSVIFVAASVLGQFLLGLTLALALRREFRGRGVYQAIVFLPWAFSAFVIGLMFRWSFNGEYGVINDLLQKFGWASEKIAWLGTPGLSLTVVILAMIWMGVPFFAIMILAALGCFVQLGLTNAIVLIVIISREFMVTALRLVASGSGKVVAANNWGKAKTISQIVAVLVVMLLQYLLELGNMGLIAFGDITAVGGIFSIVGESLLWVSAALTIISGIIYIVQNFEFIKNAK